MDEDEELVEEEVEKEVEEPNKVRVQEEPKGKILPTMLVIAILVAAMAGAVSGLAVQSLSTEEEDTPFNYKDDSVGIGTSSPDSELDVDGVISAEGGDSEEWNTAYGWGDHSEAGYLTGYTETDPVYGMSAASGITSDDITDWDAAYDWGDHSSEGYLTGYSETDPVFGVSAASGITSGDTANWNTAYGWGDHSTQGYLTSISETDPMYGMSIASGITFGDITKWDSAYSWGDHSLQGYLTSFAEADPVYGVSVASGITSGDVTDWDTAYSWGDHSSEGYLTNYAESDPVYGVSVASGITSGDLSNWNAAYSWGDHSSEGYLTSYAETDPVYGVSVASGIISSDISDWDTAYSWGDHSTQGYLTSYAENDPVYGVSVASGITSGDISEWDTAYSWGDHTNQGYLTVPSVGEGDLSDGTYNFRLIATAPFATRDFRGRMTDSNGDPIDGLLNVGLSLYDDEMGMAPLWTEETMVQVDNGILSFAPGEMNPLTDLYDEGELWWGVTIEGGSEMTPRFRDYGVDIMLSEDEVDAYVANNGYLTDVYWFQISDIPIDIADGDQDTIITESQVDAYVANNGYDTTDDAWTGTGDMYTTSGNVGIGTTTPGGKLTIQHSYDSTSARANHIYLRDSTNANLKGFIGINRNSAAGADQEYLSIQAVEEGVHWLDLALAAGGGNVGIGTTSPDSKLEVAGTVTATEFQDPTPVSFSAYNSGGDSYSSAESKIVEFDTEEYDYGDNYNSASDTFTAPTSGVYQFNVMVTALNVMSGDMMFLNLFKNGVSFKALETRNSGDSGEAQGLSGSVTVRLNAGDTIQVYFDVLPDASWYIVGNPKQTHFSGHRVC